MTRSLLTACVLTVALATAASARQGTIHLASLQIVQVGGRPTLVVAADGPIAVAPEPAAAGQPPSADRLRLRLYGVAPTADLLRTPAAPFVVTVTAAGSDTILDVQAPGLTGAGLQVGTAMRASELRIVIR